MAKRSSDLQNKGNKSGASVLDAAAEPSEDMRPWEENQHLRQVVEEQNAKLAILQSVQEGLASRLEVQAIYELVGDKIREIFAAQGTAVYTFNHDTETLETPYCYLKKRFAIEARPFSDHPIADLMVHKIQPILYRTLEEYRALGGAILENSEEYKSGMYVPLMVGKDIKGMLGVANLDKENAYGDADLRLLSTLADGMSVALENARLFDETQRLLRETEQRNAELSIINSVQQGLASKLEFQSIIDLVGDQVHAITQAKSVSIALYDKVSGMVSWPYWLTLGERIEINPGLMEKNITRQVMYASKPLNLSTEQEILAHDAVPPRYGWTVGKSFLGVPFTVGNSMLGALCLHDFDQEYAFDTTDERLLQTLANSMSVALENARLFDETEQRNAELAIINSVQEGLASKLDMQSIYELVGDKIRQIFHNMDAEIRILDPVENRLRFPYITDLGQRIVVDPLPMNEMGISAHVLRTGQTVVINENILQEMEKYGSKFIPGGHEAKSAVFVPLVIGSQARGLIVLGDLEREHAFSESDVRLLQTLASSMSTALENAHLFDEVQKKNAEVTEALGRETVSNNILQVIAESPTNIQPVLDVIARNAAQLSMSDDAIITLGEGETLHVDAHYGNIPTFSLGEEMRFHRDTVTGRAILTGRPLQAIHNQDGIRSEYPEGDRIAQNYGYRMTCAVPLLREGKAIGAISIRRIKPELLTEKQITLIQSFANQAAIAVENVRLFNETMRLLKETEQHNAELAIINSVQEGLASKLDMQAIYDLVGDKIRDLFNAQSVWIQIYDHAAQTREFKYGFYKRPHHIPEPLPYNKLTEHLIATKRPLVINHDADVRKNEFDMVIVAGSEMFKSAVFVPLIAGDEVKGVITIQDIDRENAFSESDVNLLSTLASSMSVALENARLFDETQRLFLEAQEARTIAEQGNQAKSAFLSSMSHELRTPLNAIINFVEMVARGMIGPVNREQVELLDQALYSSKHLLNLINDVLDISKIQAGQLTLFVEEDVSVQVEVDVTLSIVGGLIQEKGLHLIRDIDPHLPMLSCDRRRLRQVLLNLVSNAIKFTNQGTVTVSVKDEGPQLLFAVIDTGPGIPLDKQDLIFEPFIQAENGERQLQGTGLGLPISRSLIRAHGGELWVDSEAGEGSAFFFTLPVHRKSTP